MTRRDWLLVSAAIRKALAEAHKLPETLTRRSIRAGIGLAAYELCQALAAAAQTAGLRFDEDRFMRDALGDEFMVGQQDEPQAGN